MCGPKTITVALLAIFISVVYCSENGEYFWRPWTAGSPPSDAINGRDYRGASYIVEAYSPSYGEFVGQAFANQHDVNVSAVLNATVVTKAYSLKVLCSQTKDKLAWYPTTSKSLDNDLITGVINPVIGGYSHGQVVYVGRVIDFSLRTVLFGSIRSDYRLYYHNLGKAYIQTNYEILIVDDKKCTSN